MEKLGELLESQIDKLLSIYGEQTIELVLFGLMFFVFFMSGYMIIKQQSSVRKKGRHTTGEIVSYENTSTLFKDMPVVKFEMDGKQVHRECHTARLKRADYPVGTVIDIMYLDKRTFGLNTTHVYIDTDELRHRQGHLSAMVFFGFGILFLLMLVSRVV